MIFYGTNASRLKDGKLKNVTCPACGTTTSFTYSVFGKYFYIYWIPIIPLGKTTVLECDHCKKTFKLKELPKRIQDKFELEEKHRGIPFQHFAGLGIIFALIVWISYSSMKDKENEATYIAKPQVGDIYRTEGSSSNYYTTAKVVSVVGDSIYVVFNDYETNKRTGISDIDISKNYNSENKEGYTLQEVQGLYKDEVIYQIDRD